MPNLKIFVDQSLGAQATSCLAEALPGIREFLCRELAVEPALAQLAIVPVNGIGDQALLSVEMQILPGARRTREVLIATGEALSVKLRAVVAAKVAIRITTVDPANYIVMR